LNFVVIGTDHHLQEVDNGDNGLMTLLQSKLSESEVVLIAEETRTSKDVETFGKQLIGNEKWLSIDMNAEERAAAHLGDLPCQQGPGYDPVTHTDIVVNRYHKAIETIRENFWLDKIFNLCDARNISDGTVIITCGHNHLPFLAEKIESRGHTVSQDEYMPYDKVERHSKFKICE
jgi:hypothetical protein